MKSRAASQKGAAAVEFAIIANMLLVLVFGISEFGVLLYDKAVVTNASREGARAGIVFSNPDISDTEIASVVENYCKDFLINLGNPSVSGCSLSPAPKRETDVDTGVRQLTVYVSFQYDYLVLPNFVAGIMGHPTLTAETVMRMENQNPT